MKRNLQILLTATTASLLTLTGIAQDNTRSTAERTGYGRDRMHQSQPGRLHSAVKASDIIGMTVKNHQDEELGSVKDLALDMESGRIVAVVVSSGGFLGMGNELSAVPPTALSFNAERDALRLDATKDMMSAAPHFKSDQWPDFSQAEYSDRVYRAYKQEPYFTTNAVSDGDSAKRDRGNAMRNCDNAMSERDNAMRDRGNAMKGRGDAEMDRNRAGADQGNSMTNRVGAWDRNNARTNRNRRVTDVDNTDRNVRDRGDRTLTPFDQGNSAADTDTTAQIRKGIVAGNGMSVNAKNVKIITSNGRVTLRGPVASEEEKRQIGDIANRIAQSENVDNQLEVTAAEHQ